MARFWVSRLLSVRSRFLSSSFGASIPPIKPAPNPSMVCSSLATDASSSHPDLG